VFFFAGTLMPMAIQVMVVSRTAQSSQWWVAVQHFDVYAFVSNVQV
jgi:hypothetical protein